MIDQRGNTTLMVRDLNLIHPELHQVFKRIPQFSYHRGNLWLIRWLINLQPTSKIPGDIQIDNLSIQSQDLNHKIHLRIYKPKSIGSPAPVLVWMHGGGFIIGKPKMDDPCLIQFAQELGITIVSVDYRFAPEHPFPNPLDDCYTALKWVYYHGQSMGIDPDRIAIGGKSAGGGLAATLVQLAHDRNEVKPIFQMLVYPMLDDRSSIRSDLANEELMIWTQENNRFAWEAYLQQKCGSDNLPPYSVASRREDLSGFPPTWLAVGTLDLFYEEDVAYAQKLKHCGVECELVVIPGAFHGFDSLNQQLQIVRDFRKSQIAALKKQLFPE